MPDRASEDHCRNYGILTDNKAQLMQDQPINGRLKDRSCFISNRSGMDSTMNCLNKILASRRDILLPGPCEI